MSVIIDGTNGIDKIAAGAIEYADLPTGSVLQVVNATGGAVLTTSSTSYVDTTLSASITPKFSTSKILVMVNHGISGADAATSSGINWNLVRNSTVIFNDTNLFAHPTITYFYAQGWTTVYLDSPATTSATTYKTQVKSAAGSQITIDSIGSVAKMTLMEIAA